MKYRNVPCCLLLATLTAACGPLQTPASRFLATEDSAPQSWKGNVFELSQNYPSTERVGGNYEWEDIDFKAEPHRFMESVKRYLLEGNLVADWDVGENTVRTWYHAPWMHTGVNGREFVRGLTRERSSFPKELHENQESCWQNWAVAFYNHEGGQTLQQVWEDHVNPDPGKSEFATGAMAAKLLFTQASVDEVPYLSNSLTWKANIHEQVDDVSNQENGYKRVLEDLRLLQVDIAVKVEDKATGWVFGTYIYKELSYSEDPWDNVHPVGIMWGNDPELTAERYAAGDRVAETWINPAWERVRFLGYHGRLNGPVDNPKSSCLSCHSTSQWPMRANLAPDGKLPTQMWFRNLKHPEPFTEGAVSTDYSLQIALGIQNFRAHEQGLGAPFNNVLDCTPPDAPSALAESISVESSQPTTISVEPHVLGLPDLQEPENIELEQVPVETSEILEDEVYPIHR